MNSNQTPHKGRTLTTTAQQQRQMSVPQKPPPRRQNTGAPHKPPHTPVTAQKRGISPTVILLLFLAIVAILLAYATLSPKSKEQNKQQNSQSSPNNTVVTPPSSDSSLPPSTNEGDHTDPPADIPSTPKPKLTVNSITETFPSGSYVIYGYPVLEIEDAPDITERINQKLTLLVDDIIVPMVEQLRTEDAPGNMTSRLYSFEVYAGCGFYSIVATVDINEGITSARSIFGWTFLADTGKYVELRENCSDLYRLAVTVDGCIENVTSYDQIIHAWLKDTLTAEYDSDEFSFYFSEEDFIAVINAHLRLNSYDRDPILIRVPYEKIINIFPNQTKE